MSMIFEVENHLYDSLTALRRRIFLPLARFLVASGFTADVVSVIQALVGTLAAILFIDARVAAGSLLLLSVLLDNIDGQVAELRGDTSEWGVFVDIGTDTLVFVVFACMSSVYGLVPWPVCCGLTVCSIVQWPLGALRVSHHVARPTCEMGLFRQIPKYAFIFLAVLWPEVLGIAAMCFLVVLVLDVVYLVYASKAILLRWRAEP